MVPDSHGLELIGHVIITLLIVLVAFLVVSVILYVIKSFAMYKLSKSNGEGELAVLAWIPIANIYVYSELARVSNKRSVRILITSVLIALYLMNIFLLGLLSELVITTSLAYLTINVILLGSLAQRCSRNVVKHVIIAVFTIGMSIPIQILAFRKSILTYNEDLTL